MIFFTATVAVSLADEKFTSSRSFKLTVADGGAATAIDSGVSDHTESWPVPLSPPSVPVQRLFQGKLLAERVRN